MNDLFDSLLRPDWAGAPDIRTILFMIVMAFTVGMFIGYVYMWTHESLSYSRTFVGALAVLPLIVAMLIASMAASLLVAFGLLAVFGVVRFRNVLKDTRDTSFILWVIMEGMAVGTMRFSITLLAAFGIAAAFLLVRFMGFGTRRRYDAVLSLRVTGDFQAKLALLKQVLQRHALRLDLASERRAAQGGVDLTYRVLLRDAYRSSDLQSELAATEGVENVSVYMHEDEAEI